MKFFLAKTKIASILMYRLTINKRFHVFHTHKKTFRLSNEEEESTRFAYTTFMHHDFIQFFFHSLNNKKKNVIRLAYDMRKIFYFIFIKTTFSKRYCGSFKHDSTFK